MRLQVLTRSHNCGPGFSAATHADGTRVFLALNAPAPTWTAKIPSRRDQNYPLSRLAFLKRDVTSCYFVTSLVFANYNSSFLISDRDQNLNSCCIVKLSRAILSRIFALLSSTIESSVKVQMTCRRVSTRNSAPKYVPSTWQCNGLRIMRRICIDRVYEV